ncbi:MAG TPA: adenylate/guanylate cyclase domain-containing protein [Gaiellaceae bacterium]|nr:adenylate/guanylate cyclase domain-containing protein [Gaiellaceae bacterium]
MADCLSCGVENPAGSRFCGGCGASLSRVCPACGAANDGAMRFCNHCGAQLDEQAVRPAATSQAPAAVQPGAERRLVSVLFADLVGFTSLSESRDAEEVRELLSRYFDGCRRLIELYGGTVEKFIGDAVMAVWGTPVATEDDAERAVRAALDLVAAVSALGDEVGAVGLRARAGVLTGEAAVNLAAVGEGMVAGDLVNTASRVQSVAEPGSVFVGEATRRASQRAIVYEDAGSFVLKGKEGETPLWRAQRVVSGVGGSLKSEGLEAPFVGRGRELRQIKDLFHVCADERRAQLVSVTGIAGIGKSRLAWEFYKYFDGLDQTVYWHRGRCLSYGEGVTYWALADMVRMRCLIAEDEEPASALSKLQAALDEHLLDPEERRFVEPRLAKLLGLGEQETRDRQDLFAAWRLFFERLAETYPTVLAFEDMHWADASLLDFVEYLLEWSRDKPLYVLTLARPELLERRPNWGAGHRNFSSLYLEPLAEQAMHELLIGLVPGLPPALRSQILARAEGVPLYAVETVRMLLDRGLLVEDGTAYEVVGEIGALEVPETLQALVAARLDGLTAEERRLVQDAAVLGKTFTRSSLAALTGQAEGDLEPLLAGLVRKELLGLQSDPRSPEHGQYGFLQDIVRSVAYETLSKRDRRAKHLAAAEHLAATLGEDEVAEVVASHLLDAYRLDPDAAEAESLRARACAALLRAGERAASLGAAFEAQRYFEQAAELAVEPGAEAAALTRAGEMSLQHGDMAGAERIFTRAVSLYEETGEAHAAARATAWLAYSEERLGDVQGAVERMEHAYQVIGEDEPDADLAFLLTRLGGAHFFAGNLELAAERAERGLAIAEALRLPEVLARGWNVKAMATAMHKPQEARALHQLALDTARANQLHDAAMISIANLSDLALQGDRYGESLAYLTEALEEARRTGSRLRESFVLAEMSYALTMLGRWDEALARVDELSEAVEGRESFSVIGGPLEVHLHRGEVAAARELLARFEALEGSSDLQSLAGYATAEAAVLLAEGNREAAFAAAERSLDVRDTLGIAHQDVKHALRHALEASLALGRRERAEELVALMEGLPIGLRPPFLDATAHRFRARLAGDSPAADVEYVAAESGLRRLELPFHLAVVQLEHGEWLTGQGRPEDAQSFLADAHETFERLRATPWLQRLGAAQSGMPAETVA